MSAGLSYLGRIAARSLTAPRGVEGLVAPPLPPVAADAPPDPFEAEAELVPAGVPRSTPRSALPRPPLSGPAPVDRPAPPAPPMPTSPAAPPLPPPPPTVAPIRPIFEPAPERVPPLAAAEAEEVQTLVVRREPRSPELPDPPAPPLEPRAPAAAIAPPAPPVATPLQRPALPPELPRPVVRSMPSPEPEEPGARVAAALARVDRLLRPTEAPAPVAPAPPPAAGPVVSIGRIRVEVVSEASPQVHAPSRPAPRLPGRSAQLGPLPSKLRFGLGQG